MLSAHHPHGPQRLGMTSEATYVFHTLSTHHLHIILVVPGSSACHPCSPWRLGMTLGTTYFITHHLHVISLVPDVVNIDTGHLHMVSNVVPIDRGYPTLFPHVHGYCPHIIPIVLRTSAHHSCGPQRLEMTSGTTYVISIPSPWSLMWLPLTQAIHSLFPLS